MANRLFQSLIHQMKDAMDRVIGVVDDHSTVIACSELGKMGETIEMSPDFAAPGEVFTYNGMTFKSIGENMSSDYYVFVQGDDPISEKYCLLLSIAFSNIKFYYDEKYDRSNFIKNVILENILPGDIYLRSRELHFNNDVSRTVLLIRTLDHSDIVVYDIIQKLFPEKNKDFVISINETDIALIKETKPNIETKHIEKLAMSISDTLAGEFYTSVAIGIGTTVASIKDLAKSFKEAQAALEVGKVFDTDKTIVSYDNLGIARLVYQLPTTLCETFLKEVFKRGSIQGLDQEMLFTIQKFFENDLNVSKTAEQIPVHRNTLVYRLDKIKRITGLDLREFDQAILFKIALMVNKYLQADPVKF